MFMKKIFAAVVLFCFLFLQNSVFASNIKIYADKVDGYPMKTVTKKYTPYSLTMVNNDKETVYFSAKSEVKYETEAGELKTLLDDEAFYKKVRKREVGRYFWVALPSAAIGGFITGASFFLLVIPGIGIALAGSLPSASAVKYNSKLAQDFYVDNGMPLNLDAGSVKNIYVFLPKTENVKKIIITNVSTKNSKQFDLEIPVI